MRLIDADAVKDNITEWLECVGNVMIGRGLSYTWELEGCVDDAPTIDAVEIVRCQDCQFCLYNEAAGTYKCRSQQGLSRFVEPTDFCSWGERVVEDA